MSPMSIAGYLHLRRFLAWVDKKSQHQLFNLWLRSILEMVPITLWDPWSPLPSFYRHHALPWKAECSSSALPCMLALVPMQIMFFLSNQGHPNVDRCKFNTMIWYELYVHVYMYVCMYVCMYAWMNGWMDDACMHVCMLVCIYIYIYIYIYMYLYMLVCMHNRLCNKEWKVNKHVHVGISKW